jgi:hypothetical protein
MDFHSRTTFIEKEVESHTATITGENPDLVLNMTESTTDAASFLLR